MSSHPMIFLAGTHLLLAFTFARTRGEQWRRRAIETLCIYVVFLVVLSWIDGGPGVKPTAFAAIVGAIHLGASWASVAWYHRAPVVEQVPQVQNWSTSLTREHVGVRVEEGSDPAPDSVPERADSYPPVVHAMTGNEARA